MTATIQTPYGETYQTHVIEIKGDLMHTAVGSFIKQDGIWRFFRDHRFTLTIDQ